MKQSKIKSRLEHNPSPDISKVLTIPKGFGPEDKCKLYIIMRPTPNNNMPVEVLHGVRLKNVDRVLSRRTKHNQKGAFFTIKDRSKSGSGARIFKIFSN